jgi:uncharacterized protein GlcG (DUF336 family)
LGEIAHIFSGDVEKGILSALGTLLTLWMMVELMDNEIKSLKGGRFNILVFIPLIEGVKIVGAIGCSGGTNSQDEVACKAGAVVIK